MSCGKLTVTTSTPHGFRVGDVVMITHVVPDRRWWRRLWCWVTRQPAPTITKTRECKVLGANVYELKL